MLTFNVCKSFGVHLKLRGQEQERRIEMNIPVFRLLEKHMNFLGLKVERLHDYLPPGD